jgi:hypothetical protein
MMTLLALLLTLGESSWELVPESSRRQALIGRRALDEARDMDVKGD